MNKLAMDGGTYVVLPEQTVKNLILLVMRLSASLRKLRPDSPIPDAAMRFLHDNGLQSSILRETSQPAPADLSIGGMPDLRDDLGSIQCDPSPNAQHGFDRTASHSMGRYVCICENGGGE